MNFENQTYTITYGDVAENHKGMQQIGTKLNSGFNLADIKKAQSFFSETELINLNKFLPKNVLADPAYLLIIRNGVNEVFDKDNAADKLFLEHLQLEPDTKAFMYGRVVNKKARHNLCFSEKAQEADYENGKGTIVAFTDVKLTNQLREKLGEIIGNKAKNLQAEANYYYDIDTCGIGYHGDTERKVVVGVRVGETMDLCFNWFHNCANIGTKYTAKLSHGDMYIMSDKAVGHDWKKKSDYTLRHAAGCDKFTKL